MTILQQIEALKIIPMVNLDDATDALPLAEALAEGGLPCVEITFRTAAAEAAIRAVSATDHILLGAGTVLTEQHARRAIDGGAKFIVTPGFAPKVVELCLQNDVPVFPGASTPTDLQMALDYGLEVVKFFPAEPAGGLKTLAAISAPYHMMRFIPTGGIDTDNLKAYLDFPKVVACGGSWLAKPDLIRAGKFAEITGIARAARQAVG